MNLFQLIKYLFTREKYFFCGTVIIVIIANLVELLTISLMVPFFALVLETQNTKFFGFIPDALRYFGIPWSSYYASVLIIIMIISAATLKLAATYLKISYAQKLRNILFLDAIFAYGGGSSNNIEASLSLGSGELVNNTMYRAQSVADHIIVPLFDYINAMVFGVAILAIGGFLVNVNMIYLFVFLLLLIALIKIIFGNISYKLGSAVDKHVNASTELISQYPIILKGLMINQQFDRFTYDIRELIFTISNLRTIFGTVQILPRIILEFLLILSIILFVAKTNFSDLQDKLPIIAAMIYGFQRLLPIINQTINANNLMQIGHKSFDELQNFINFRKDKAEQVSYGSQKTTLQIKSLELYPQIFIGAQHTKFEISKTIRLPSRGLVTITGESGVGKSTFLGVLSGVYNSPEFSLKLNGDILNSQSIRDLLWGNIGYVDQNPYLITATVLENIITFKSSSQDIETHATSLMNGLSLPHKNANQAEIGKFLNRLVKSSSTSFGVSGGQRQRLNIARAFGENHPLIFMDEPTSQLDKESQTTVLDFIARKSKETLIIIVTHDDYITSYAQLTINLEKNATTVYISGQSK
jgi:ABC-type transport system involved in cytochrome bd biosynthesis fused ATPase/permease subunit